MPYTGGVFGFGGPAAVDVPITSTPESVESNGAYALVLFVDGLFDGDYLVRVGPLASTQDPRCYVYQSRATDGEADDVHGYTSAAKDGVLSIFSPVLPVGGPYRFTIIPTSGGTVVTLPILVVTTYTYRSRVFSLRSWLPERWRVGARRLLGAPLQ